MHCVCQLHSFTRAAADTGMTEEEIEDLSKYERSPGFAGVAVVV